MGLNERATHALVVTKTGPARDNMDRLVCRFEKASGRFRTEFLNSARGAFPGLAKIDTSEIARAHPSHFCQRLDGQVRFEIVPNPIMKVLEPAACIAHLLTQFDAELRLAAWSLEKKNHPTGYVERREVAQIVLNHRQRHIYSGRNSGRRPDAARGDKNRVGVNLYRRVLLLKPVANDPVRRCLKTVQNTEFGKDERAVQIEPSRRGQSR